MLYSKVIVLIFGRNKQGCVYPMVIWPAFRMEKYKVNDHPYHAPQFIRLRD